MGCACPSCECVRAARSGRRDFRANNDHEWDRITHDHQPDVHASGVFERDIEHVAVPATPHRCDGRVLVAVILVVALVAGVAGLQAFGINMNAFKMAGNLLVATLGWAMLTTKPLAATVSGTASPVVVPLAMPLIAGPGAISLVITFAHGYTSAAAYIAGACIIIAVSAVITVALMFASPSAGLVERRR